MIWTEEENEIRQFENIVDPTGKTCANCQWSNGDGEDKIITCGHHIDNFSANSFCSYWTDRNDPKVKAYFQSRKAQLNQNK